MRNKSPILVSRMYHVFPVFFFIRSINNLAANLRPPLAFVFLLLKLANVRGTNVLCSQISTQKRTQVNIQISYNANDLKVELKR